MGIADQLRILEAAQDDPALLALATVDLAYGSHDQATRSLIKRALLAAAIPHWCDDALLASLLDCAPADAKSTLAAISALSIVETFPARGQLAINVHAATRRTLRNHLRTAEPEYFRALSASVRAHLQLIPDPHARIESLYHLFAVDQEAAATECETLSREFVLAGHPENAAALAIALTELSQAGWLTGSAQVEALLAPLVVRCARGEQAQIEPEARELVRLASAGSSLSARGRAFGVLCEVLQARGRLSDALDAASAEMECFAQLTAAESSHAGWKYELGVAHSRVGDTYEAQGRLDDALNAFNECLAICRKLVAADPANAGWQRELGVARARVGGIHAAQGRLDDALNAFSECLAIFRKLSATDSANAGWQQVLGATHQRVGAIYAAQGRLDDARNAYNDYLAISRKLAAADPSNLDWQRGLGIARSRVGSIHEAQGRLDDALNAFNEDLAISRKLAAADPSNLDWQRDLGIAHARVGGIHEAQGRLDDALSAFDEDLAIHQRLAAADASNATWREGLGVAHSRVGGIYEAQGRLDDALNAFNEDLAISRRLAAADPSNLDWQQGLAVAHARVGGIYEAQGRLDDALNAFNECLAICRRLAAADPSNAGWQRDLGVAHSRVGGIREAQGRFGDALTAYNEYLAIFEKLVTLDPQHADWRQNYARARARVSSTQANTYTPRYTSLVTLLSTTVSRFPNRPMFGTRTPRGWHYLTYAQFDEQVAAMRGGLEQLGVRVGDRVAVISDNRVEWAVGSFGTLSLGAAYVPMYQAQSDAQLEFILRDAGARVCLCANNQMAERIRKLRPDLPELEHIIAFDSADYEQLLEQGRKTSVPAPDVDPNRLAFLMYTSGTIGNPKGVELTHLNLGAAASSTLEAIPLTEGHELTVAFLPWAHVFGGCVELSAMIGVGGALAICDKADRLLDYLAEVKPTTLFTVPRIWNRVYENINKLIDARPAPIQKLLRTGLAARAKRNRGEALSGLEQAALLAMNTLLVDKIKARLGGRLRFAVTGAAALAPDVAELLDSLGIMLLEGYGLTESTAGGTASKPNERRIGSAGKPTPGMRVAIDPEVANGGAGQGEIILYGPSIMRGYHNLPEQTRAVFTSDGGLRTGDLGCIDKDGFLFITGRVKELYTLRDGSYVAPAALEEKLQLSPYIAQAFVYGSERPHNAAVIVVELANVKEYCRNHGLNIALPPERLLQLPQVRELFRREIDLYSRDFKGHERIGSFVLTAEPFTPDNDLMTQTLKIKRRNIYIRYQQDLLALAVGE